MSPLIPADRERCQAEKPNGHSFMTLGGRPGRVRCDAKPVFLVVEQEINPTDGRRGSMCLCAECKAVMSKQMPGAAVFEIDEKVLEEEKRLLLEALRLGVSL